MNKTILQALLDEIHYPISEGFAENKLLARGLNPNDMCTVEVLNSASFKGTTADCLVSLVEAPNFSEADKSINLADRNMILKRAASIYKSIGEESSHIEPKPMVFFGYNPHN